MRRAAPNVWSDVRAVRASRRHEGGDQFRLRRTRPRHLATRRLRFPLYPEGHESAVPSHGRTRCEPAQWPNPANHSMAPWLLSRPNCRLMCEIRRFLGGSSATLLHIDLLFVQCDFGQSHRSFPADQPALASLVRELEVPLLMA